MNSSFSFISNLVETILKIAYCHNSISFFYCLTLRKQCLDCQIKLPIINLFSLFNHLYGFVSSRINSSLPYTPEDFLPICHYFFTLIGLGIKILLDLIIARLIRLFKTLTYVLNLSFKSSFCLINYC